MVEQNMSAEIDAKLTFLGKEVSKISEAIVRIAEQDQKIINLYEKFNRVERDVDEIYRIIAGPEGLLVRHERINARMMVFCSGVSIVLPVILTVTLTKFL